MRSQKLQPELAVMIPLQSYRKEAWSKLKHLAEVCQLIAGSAWERLRGTQLLKADEECGDSELIYFLTNLG